MMMENGLPPPDDQQFAQAIRAMFQNDVLPLMERHNTEVIESRMAQVAKALQEQLQGFFNSVDTRFKALESPRPGPGMAQGPGAQTVGDRASYTLDIGGKLVDTIVKAAQTIIPLWNSYQSTKYSYGLNAESIANLRMVDPIRAATLAQMLNPDPMITQLPAYTFNMLSMGAQAGLRMKNALVPGGAALTPSSGLPSSTSGPGSSTPQLTPVPPVPAPAAPVPSGASMSAPALQQLMSEALQRVAAKQRSR